MDALLIQPSDPFFQGLRSKRSVRRARKHARKLLARPDYRAKIEKIYRTWIGYFERHLKYPFLWENNPLEIEYFLLALKAHTAHIPKGAFPPIENAIVRLLAIASQSREIREQYLPANKIILLSERKRAPKHS